MKNSAILTIIAFLITFLSPASARAQDGFFAGNTQALFGEDTIVSAEYAWAKGDLSGFGFADVVVGNDFYITDHEVRYHVANPVYISGELGYNRFGGTTVKIGIGASLSDVPFIEGNFVFLNVNAQKVLAGPEGDYVLGVAWETKPLKLTEGMAVYASGFADFKSGAPDVIQPQAWLKFGDSPVEIGAEVAIFGEETSVFAALKYKF